MSEAKLIVGLGNPGQDYEYTRHNLGFLVLTQLAHQHGFKFKKSSLTDALEAKGKILDQDVVLLLPLTYVNQSGIAVNQVVSKKEIPLKDALVVCDDLNIGFGEIRLRSSGNDGGHNGLKSIITHLKTNDFPRLRLGIGAPFQKEETRDFVLAQFTQKEKKAINAFIEEASQCCVIWLSEGINKAMSQFNKRKGNE